MFKQPEVRDIDASVCVEDLLGPLGYGSGKAIEPVIMEQILSESERCRRALRGKAIYTCVGKERFSDKRIVDDETLATSLDGAQSLAVAVCTVGDEIEKIIDEHFAKGNFLGGMIADVAGSRAVEDVAEKCAALICSDATALDLSTATRLSPGYGTWDTTGQRAVFGLLDPSPIGVSLNEHCMMHPKKSISFIMPLVKGETGRELEPPCHRCPMKKCGYRRK